jgi:uncharacterized repeat protein (TIGR04076 family)
LSRRPRLRITLLERKGPRGCHHGHRPGDSWDFDTERGSLCPMAMHVAFIYADILRYGGSVPGEEKGTARFCCPDPDTMNVFRIEVVDGDAPRDVPFRREG